MHCSQLVGQMFVILPNGIPFTMSHTTFFRGIVVSVLLFFRWIGTWQYFGEQLVLHKHSRSVYFKIVMKIWKVSFASFVVSVNDNYRAVFTETEFTCCLGQCTIIKNNIFKSLNNCASEYIISVPVNNRYLEQRQ